MRFTTLYELKLALELVHQLESTGSTESSPSFYRPFHWALLAIAAQRCNIKSLEMSGYDKKFEKYAARMHLWKALGLKSPVHVNERDPTGRFHPLTRLDSNDAVDVVSNKLSALFGEPSTETVQSVSIAVAELVGNSFSHSNISSGLRGFVCAQKWPRVNTAQIAIVDQGVGIRESLASAKEYSEKLKTTNACELATKYEVTSKRGNGHAGYGLTLAKDLLAESGGAFFLLSHDEYYYMKAGHEDRGSLDHPLHGTLVVLEWNTNVPLVAESVYNSWPHPEGDYDDFNF